MYDVHGKLKPLCWVFCFELCYCNVKCLNNVHLLFSLQDRLIYLDIADDFLAKAKRFYPPKDDSDEEPTGLSINLPLLLARMEAMNGRGDNDDEEEDSDGNLSDRS